MIANKLFTRVGVKWSSVQISVVVAYIQTSLCFWSDRNLFIISDSKALKAVEEKVSLRVALMQRSVGPKRPEKSNKQ